MSRSVIDLECHKEQIINLHQSDNTVIEIVSVLQHKHSIIAAINTIKRRFQQ